MSKIDKILILALIAAVTAIGLNWAYSLGKLSARVEAEQRYQQGYEQGKIDGFKEAQSADLIADRCVAFWFRDTRESTKALDRFCKRNEK